MTKSSFDQWKKWKLQKSYFDTFKWTSKESETAFFGAITQSQKSLPAYTALRIVKIKLYKSGPNLKKLIYLFHPWSPYL